MPVTSAVFAFMAALSSVSGGSPSGVPHGSPPSGEIDSHTPPVGGGREEMASRARQGRGHGSEECSTGKGDLIKGAAQVDAVYTQGSSRRSSSSVASQQIDGQEPKARRAGVFLRHHSRVIPVAFLTAA